MHPTYTREPVPHVNAESVSLAFAGVPYSGSVDHVARCCLEAIRAVVRGKVHLEVPTAPVPLRLGDPADRLVPVLRFRALGGLGVLWTEPDLLSPGAEQALEQHLVRVWEAQAERASQTGEVEQLRFHLNALQQVARTLSVVQGVEETERAILDFVREIFFAWWGALYRSDEPTRYVRRAESRLRDAAIPPVIASASVRDATDHGGIPFVPGDSRVEKDMLPADTAVIVPLDLGESEGGLLVLGPRMNDQPYQGGDLGLLRTLADSSAVALRNAALVDVLRTQVSVDPLTGCLNRRGFDDRMEVELARSRRYGRPISVVLLDLDHFKELNDAYGHDVGDYALRLVGEALRNGLRSTDSVCRYGGEEFALLLPETHPRDAQRLAERMRKVLAELGPDEVLSRSLTASFGVASIPENAADAAQLLRAADQALYRAKADGRDCVRVAEEGASAAPLPYPA